MRTIGDKPMRTTGDKPMRTIGDKPMRTTGDKLRNGKDPVHPFERQGAVYCVPCGNCDQKHFGETKRSFNTRKKSTFTI